MCDGDEEGDDLIPGLVGSESDDEVPVMTSDDQEESDGEEGDGLDPNVILVLQQGQGSIVLD